MKKFIRVWRELDLKDIEKFLIVIGELSAECYACHKLGIDVTACACPACNAYFKYIAFRRKLEPSHLKRFREMFPEREIIDFDDFKKVVGKRNAHKLLDL